MSPRPTAPGVTILAVTSIAMEATVQALRLSMSEVNFDDALLISDRRIPGLEEDGIKWRQVQPIRSKAEYSRFMLHQLPNHVSTPHVLCIQWDGHVLRGAGWRSEFLEYDYIGAVWPQFSDDHKVGNGGFSLRSKRLLDALKTFPYDDITPEDILIGRSYRPQLEAMGLRFAPESVAMQFSFERTSSTGSEFGFHGAFNLVERRSPGEIFRLLKSLEPQVLSQNEHKELLRWATRKGYLRIASLLIGRMMRQRKGRH